MLELENKNKTLCEIQFTNHFINMTVPEMCKKFGFKYKDLGFDRWKINNGELNDWKIIYELVEKERNRLTGEREYYQWKLMHKGYYVHTQGVDYDGYHFQRRFIDLNYLGNYLLQHKKYKFL